MYIYSDSFSATVTAGINKVLAYCTIQYTIMNYPILQYTILSMHHTVLQLYTIDYCFNCVRCK